MSEPLILEAQIQTSVESESVTTTTQIDDVSTTTLPAPSTCTTLPPKNTMPVEPIDTEPTFSEIETVEVSESRILPAPFYVC